MKCGIKHKKNSANSGYGLLYLERPGRILAIESGSRGRKTLRRLWIKIRHLKPFAVATDKWKVYRAIIPKNLLIQTKELTQTVESVNGQIRNYLARFNRKTKRYSKGPQMVEASLAILCHMKLS